QIRRGMRGWSLVRGAIGTRRITANTRCELSGPARAHALLATDADPQAMTVLGTFANCAGGKTPWGTYLTAEENVTDYFGRGESMLATTPDGALREAHRRMPPLQTSLYGWEYVDPRFNLELNPSELLRFGWIVEIDPQRPDQPPRKRTALGRFEHEGANTILAPDGRVAVYMGDDERFEYVYKFVTRDAFDAKQPDRNRDLLDEGTLYVARFDADGTGEWLPLVHDENGPLSSRAGFQNQGDVVIKARAAADLVGATPMDRPEDVEPSPLSRRVYIACTKLAERVSASATTLFNGRYLNRAANAANPRSDNRSGHVIELIENHDDPAATTFSWNIFLLAGDPVTGRFLTDASTLTPGALAPNDTYFAGYSDRNNVSRIHCPDNLGFDPAGRLWIVTDGDGKGWPNNGCYVVPTDGADRGRLQQLLSSPAGSEVCGCEFTPDGRTLFLSIQHPGEGGTLAQPLSDWPDRGGKPPRASVIAIERDDGGTV
ncbi:MAG TPA: PhoX family phosphatase, partial [Steroidobacteraceae bacterium]|nr:PhoX family phosphatase [Steroidobacteraceae bacterium]